MNQASLSSLFEREFTDARDNWKARCPFHDERTPSFFVHKEEYIANCFGCGKSGSIDVLGAEYAGITEKQVQERLGITITERVQSRLRRNAEVASKKAPERFPESWLAPWKKEIHAYTTTRGFTNHTLARAQTRYDRNKQRQVFPWRTPDGVLRGATGRTVSDHPAKWYHYWDFDKGRWLYELPLPRDLRRSPLQVQEPTDQRVVQLGQGRPLLVVEGIFDLLWVVQESDYENVVAPIAARLTYEQAQQVKERATHVIIGLDNDEAGIRGSAVAYRQLRKSCQVFFVDWPADAKDWMDLDGESIARLLRNPLTYPEWAKRIRRAGQESLIESRTRPRRKER